MVQSVKFENGQVFPYNTLPSMYFTKYAGIKANSCEQKGFHTGK